MSGRNETRMENPVTESSSPPECGADKFVEGDSVGEAATAPEPFTRLASDAHLKPLCTFEQIRTFLAVASREHVTHAARALGLSQPAVTQQVHQLERALGVPLLQRVGRNVQLTDGGLRWPAPAFR